MRVGGRGVDTQPTVLRNSHGMRVGAALPAGEQAMCRVELPRECADRRGRTHTARECLGWEYPSNVGIGTTVQE